MAGTKTQERNEVVKSTRRTLGAPKVQSALPARALDERRPPTREEIEARQKAMRETRRPTKSDEGREKKNPRNISVPDVPPTTCDEQTK